ncbi:hypothetical protein FACS1894154_04820 [Betaproteobacteria bacterium]|nr:hypothetical protein FACS1894154_04820 [Betaproteobacteria bacterium]GHU24242.1 hypothetical protein FACS189488_08490 [Betaproteobacteria bacterium]GHU31945.1 hypothetical protein FACS189497_13190 [Betaproteobacteria bacterium]
MQKSNVQSVLSGGGLFGGEALFASPLTDLARDKTQGYVPPAAAPKRAAPAKQAPIDPNADPYGHLTPSQAWNAGNLYREAWQREAPNGLRAATGNALDYYNAEQAVRGSGITATRDANGRLVFTGSGNGTPGRGEDYYGREPQQTDPFAGTRYTGMLPKGLRSINATDQLMRQQEMLARSQPTARSALELRQLEQNVNANQRDDVINTLKGMGASDEDINLLLRSNSAFKDEQGNLIPGGLMGADPRLIPFIASNALKDVQANSAANSAVLGKGPGRKSDKPFDFSHYDSYGWGDMDINNNDPEYPEYAPGLGRYLWSKVSGPKVAVGKDGRRIDLAAFGENPRAEDAEIFQKFRPRQ